MLIGTQAIVLHTLKYGDTSLIAKIYTRQKGILSFLVNGAYNKKRGSKAAFLQPLNLLSIEMEVKESRSLHVLKEVRIDYPYRSIPVSTPKTTQVLFIAEVLLKSIREQERNDLLFDFIYNTLVLLDETPQVQPNFHLKFLLEYLLPLGIYPADTYSVNTPYFRISDGTFIGIAEENCLPIAESTAIAALMKTPFSDLGELEFNRYQRQLLTDDLLRYFAWHISSVNHLKTPDILKAVFE